MRIADRTPMAVITRGARPRVSPTNSLKSNLATCAAPRLVFRSQIPQQAIERFHISIVIGLPVAEIRDKVLSDFAGRILARIGIEVFPISKRFKAHQPQREKHSAVLA